MSRARRAALIRPALLAIVLCVAALGLSHMYHGMSTRVIVGRQRVTVMLSLINQDLAVLVPSLDRDQDGFLSSEELVGSQDAATSAVAERMLVTNNGQQLVASVGQMEPLAVDSATTQPHAISFTLLYVLSDPRRFEKLHINPNLFREIPGKPLHYATPPLGSQMNQVTVFDCDAVTFETSGTRMYDSIVGKCE